MRCKEHLSDLSSTIGVCATCLRLKLTSLSSFSDHNHNHHLNYIHDHHDHDHDHDHNQKQPQPLILPGSVSPYITRQKSDQQTSEATIIQRFYSTPKVEKKKNGKFAGKFNLLSKFFRSKSSVVATTTSTASSEIEKDELTQWRNRGMSPENDFSPPSTAAKTRPSPGRVKPSQGRLASIAFCLSPLVRASPSIASRYHCGGVGGGETCFSGEIRAGKGTSNGGGKSGKYSKNGGVNGKNPQLSVAASYCGNRSRKIADFGRLNRNH